MSPLNLKIEFTAKIFKEKLLLLQGNQEEIRFNSKHVRKDGSTYPVEVHLQKSFYEEKPVFIAIITDITKRIEQEEALHQLNEKLNEKYIFEQKKSKEKSEIMFSQARQVAMGEMISMIAHQWRQPLGAISATAIDMKMKSELENFDLGEKQEAQRYEAYVNNGLNDINALVQNLTTTIDDFRNFYKLNKKSVTMKPEDLIEKSIKIIKASLENDRIKLIKEYNFKEDIAIYDNEMMQVILNILKNAQDAFKEKSIENPYIKITIENKTISICDNAGGIPEDIIDKIFDPYFSTKSEMNGSGLGLYMSKTIIEEHHNGKLKVENTDDGVCFIIEFGII